MPHYPVAYLGPEGTFSHLIARRHFSKKHPLIACPDIAGVFEYVLKNPDARAVVPIENSSGGSIYDTIDLLIRNVGVIQAQEELTLDVSLALLGKTRTNIRTIYSHFAPLMHHKDWIAENFPKARSVSVSSTALAAAKVAKTANSAALATPGAAELYGLKILQFPIQPGAVNLTRFYVIGYGEAPAVPKRPQKTTLVFSLHNLCGSLHSFLGPLSRNAVNLRMIVSRPVPGKPQTYVFFVEVDGSTDENHVASALEKAGKFCERLDIIGSFPCRATYDSKLPKK